MSAGSSVRWRGGGSRQWRPWSRVVAGDHPGKNDGAPVRVPRLASSGKLELPSACPGDVLRRRTLLPFDDVEFDSITFGKRLEAAALNRRVVHEAILRAVVGGDETETLGVVEPSRSPRIVASTDVEVCLD